MKLFLVIFFFLITSIKAQEKIYLKACSDQYDGALLAKFAHSLASPLDQIDIDSSQNCIDIFTASAKEDLFRRGLRLKFQDIQIDSVNGAPNILNAMTTSDNQCQLNFISEGRRDSHSINGNIHIGHKISGQIYAHQVNNSAQQSAMLLAGPRRSSISFDMHSFSATCKRSNAGAEVEIEVNGPSLNLRTSIVLNNNSKQFLGEIHKQHSGNSNKIETPSIGGSAEGNMEIRKIYVQLR